MAKALPIQPDSIWIALSTSGYSCQNTRPSQWHPSIYNTLTCSLESFAFGNESHYGTCAGGTLCYNCDTLTMTCFFVIEMCLCPQQVIETMESTLIGDGCHHSMMHTATWSAIEHISKTFRLTTMGWIWMISTHDDHLSAVVGPTDYPSKQLKIRHVWECFPSYSED